MCRLSSRRRSPRPVQGAPARGTGGTPSGTQDEGEDAPSGEGPGPGPPGLRDEEGLMLLLRSPSSHHRATPQNAEPSTGPPPAAPVALGAPW